MAGKRQSIIPEHTLLLKQGKKVYFASDQHFGAPNVTESREREKYFVQWLNAIQPDCGALFLLGDLFDFWFEYKYVVPKGFVRVLGKLAEFTDQGIPIYFFTGNHDMWMKDYFEKELNISIFFERQKFFIGDKKFLIAHGDGLGPGDKGFKRMKKVFRSPISNFLYRILHPDLGVWLGQRASLRNKIISGEEDVKFLGEDNEWLLQYSREKLKHEHFDYFIFGHRHLPLEIKLEPNSTYINLGDWITYYTYAVFNGDKTELKEFKEY